MNAAIQSLFWAFAAMGVFANHSPDGDAFENPGAHAYFTDMVLLDQEGREQRLYSDLIRWKVVVFSAFFASCSATCPPMNRNLKAIQEWLGDRLGKDVLLVSITVDPEKDTPERLKSFAEALGAKPGWYFLTGSRDQVQAALTKLGQYVDAPENHSNVLMVGNDRTGLWKKAFGLADAQKLIDLVAGVVEDASAPTP